MQLNGDTLSTTELPNSTLNVSSSDNSQSNENPTGAIVTFIIIFIIILLVEIFLVIFAINKTKNKSMKIILIAGLFIPPMYPIIFILALLIIFGVIN